MEHILRRIREITTPLLRNKVIINDIVFRPFDMGILGGKGYSLVLAKPPDKMYGIRFSDEPTDEEIKQGVEKVQNVIAPNVEISGSPWRSAGLTC